MFSVLAVTLRKTEEDDNTPQSFQDCTRLKYKQTFSKQKYLNRCDRHIVKLSGIFFIFLQRECILPFKSASYVDPKIQSFQFLP